MVGSDIIITIILQSVKTGQPSTAERQMVSTPYIIYDIFSSPNICQWLQPSIKDLFLGVQSDLLNLLALILGRLKSVFQGCDMVKSLLNEGLRVFDLFHEGSL